MKLVLVCNAGSSSLKFALYRWPKGDWIGGGEFAEIGTPNERLSYHIIRTRRQTKLRRGITHRQAAKMLMKILADQGITRSGLLAIGHRIVVAPPYSRTVRISAAVERAIERAIPLAPLHNPPALAVFKELRPSYPLTNIACFDTAYFADLPAAARTYAIDDRIASRYGIRKIGFHGFSHSAAAQLAARTLRRPLRSLRLLSVHLGAGSSVAAIKHGKPVDTSMGFTPLAGLVMAKRAGDLDPGILLYLLEQGWSWRQLATMLNERSGLRGLTGFTSDMREVLAAAGYAVRGFATSLRPTSAQKKRARLALQVFQQRLKKYLGGYAVILGRVDAIIFSGAMGERNATVRKLILNQLRLPGQPKVIVVHADEERQMFREVKRFLKR
ncbi:MAG: acetate kinase [Candidatus Kerfeldbacteria bacterium]|nr:acetate kinase [Candidatus Kerfeldbacteria bacterium]